MYHQAYPAARRPIRALGLLSGLCTIARAGGCVDKRGGPIPYSASNFGTRVSPSVVPLGSGYKIGPLDTLAIVGAVLTKATGWSGAYGDGYAPYRFGPGKTENQILMIPHPGDA